MKTRSDILEQAFNECLKEMYKWAQPSIDLDKLIKEGYKDDDKNPLYTKHYLSTDNFNYIKDTYMYAYGINDTWDDTFETIYNQLENGGVEDDYIPAKEGNPGYRSYKKVDSLKNHLTTPEDFNTIIEYIKKIQNFFKHHSLETNKFNVSICLGCSPTSNKEEVEKYWKENGRPDFKIKDFEIGDVIYGGPNDEYIDITPDEFVESLK